MPKGRKELSPPDENRAKAERLMLDIDKFRFAGAIQKGFSENGFEASLKKSGKIEDDFGDSFSEDTPVNGQKKRKSAKEYAMALVSAKAYTEYALRQKLKMRDYGLDETDDAVEYVKSFGYINDQRLAERAATRLAERLYGKRKIFAYLSSKGISSDVIGALDLDEIDFKENARLLAQKNAARGRSRDAVIRSLSAAGFSSSEISYALKTLYKGEDF